jgi:hypothetical protein
MQIELQVARCHIEVLFGIHDTQNAFAHQHLSSLAAKRGRAVVTYAFGEGLSTEAVYVNIATGAVWF